MSEKSKSTKRANDSTGKYIFMDFPLPAQVACQLSTKMINDTGQQGEVVEIRKDKETTVYKLRIEVPS